VFEVNGYHVVDNDTGNDGIVTPFGGAAVANLGGHSHESVVTAGLGVEVRPHSRLRAATDRQHRCLWPPLDLLGSDQVLILRA
jgi:hypothetical protein